MSNKQILAALAQGLTVCYRVRILRGYTHGYRTLIFKPTETGANNPENIKHRLKCFRADEKPYDNAAWHTAY